MADYLITGLSLMIVSLLIYLVFGHRIKDWRMRHANNRTFRDMMARGEPIITRIHL